MFDHLIECGELGVCVRVLVLVRVRVLLSPLFCYYSLLFLGCLLYYNDVDLLIVLLGGQFVRFCTHSLWF